MNFTEIASASAQIKELLTPLAEKIGQAGAYTFSLFVRQVYVNAAINALWMIPGGFSAWAAVACFKAMVNKDNDSNTQEGAALGFILFTIVAFIAILAPMTSVIQALLNPEYQAIKLIIDTVKGN